MKLVCFVIFPEVHLLDLSGPLEVFSTANELMEAKGKRPPYLIHTVASRAGVIRTQSNVSLLAGALPGDDMAIDSLIVAGGAGVNSARRDKRLIRWLKKHTPRARRIVSICSGAFILAECGILNGHRAATHWSVCAHLAREYPEVIVDKNAIFVHDGRVWTSAGVTSGIDLALELIKEDLGHSLAIDVAKNLVVFFKRPGGQNQFSATLDFQREAERFTELHAWMAENLGNDLTVGALAEFSCMSERSFSRHYLKETGLTPAKAVNRLRLDSARDMLLQTSLSLGRIAECCGFGSEVTFRRRFFEGFGCLPGDYRRSFAD